MNFYNLSAELSFKKNQKRPFYFANGYEVFEKLIPDILIDSYCEKFEKDCKTPAIGWTNNGDPGNKNTYCQAYIEIAELRNLLLCDPLVSILKEVLEDHPLLHLSLNGWKSTTRNWHQDSYLNPPYVLDSYVAVWIALEDIHPDSGPFQYCPGSHLGRVLTKDRVLSECNVPDNAYWPWETQDRVSVACENEIKEKGYSVETFLPKKGDVLIWHPYLIHRGSEPKNPDLLRKTAIAHFSSLSSRTDMKPGIKEENGKYYF